MQPMYKKERKATAGAVLITIYNTIYDYAQELMTSFLIEFRHAAAPSLSPHFFAFTFTCLHINFHPFIWLHKVM